MFNSYIKKILPIPTIKIQSSKNGYRYLVSTYASIIDKDIGLQLRIAKYMHNNKRVKIFDGWYYKEDDITQKYALVEFYKNEKGQNNNKRIEQIFKSK